MDTLDIKRLLLARVYEALEQEMAQQMDAACTEGCAWCCTQDVTVTSAEALLVLDFLREAGLEDLLERLGEADPARFKPTYTLNAFAQACFERRDIEEEGPTGEPTACLFLEDNRCLVYPVRPLACRAFVSAAACGPGLPAETPPAMAVLAAVCQQIVEHLDAGGLYGNLADVLGFLSQEGRADLYRQAHPLTAPPELLATQALPGFLIHPEVRGIVQPFLGKLFGGDVGGEAFHQRLAALRHKAP